MNSFCDLYDYDVKKVNEMERDNMEKANPVEAPSLEKEASEEMQEDHDSCGSGCCSSGSGCCKERDAEDEQNTCCDDGATQEVPDPMRQKLMEAEARRDEYLELAQRVQADFDNFRRRSKSAVADAYKSSVADTVEGFLPVMDNLERARTSAQEAEASDAMVKGIEMVIRQFKDCLYKLDVEEIEAMNATFDPVLHNAVMQVEPQDGQPSNTVAEVLQKGYKMGDKVIRYSMVRVYS